MNKKFLLGMFAAAGMLFATSCSNDDLIEQGSGDTATVSFTVNTEGAVASRAISDGESATVLKYQVLRVERRGDYEVMYHPVGDLVEDKDFHGSKTIQLQLGKGQEYAVGFWAESSEANKNEYYEISNGLFDGLTLSINYEKILNNDENSDAFFGNANFTVSGNETMNVTLKRPFAQINVGASDYEAFIGGNGNNDIVNSSVVIKNAATTLNLLNGDVSGDTDVTFDSAHGAIYLEENSSVYKPTQLLTVNGTEYTWLSMCYVLPQDKDQSTTVSAEFGFEVTAGNNFTLKDGLQNIPIQRNYRTNIIGNILTNNVDFKVEVDANFEKPDHNVNTSGELEYAAANGGVITLTGDVVVNKPFDVKGNMTLNLNGYTLTYNVPDAEGPHHLFRVQEGATLTLDGGEIVVNDPHGVRFKPAAGCYVASALPGGKIIVNGGSYTAQDCTVFQADGGTVEINGGTFDITETKWGYKYMLNIRVEPGREDNGKIVVKGGKFHNFDPANNEADGNGTNYVATGYKSVENNGWYYVITNNGAVISNAEELKTFAQNYMPIVESQTVVLAADIDLAGEKWTPINAGGTNSGFNGVFEGYGHTIKNFNIDWTAANDGDAAGFFGWLGVGTVKNVNFKDVKVLGNHYVGVVVGYNQFGVIENCTVENAEIVCSYKDNDCDGGKCGGIVGMVGPSAKSIVGCHVANTTIKAMKDAGQVIGMANPNNTNINGNTANNVSVTRISGEGANVKNEIIGRTN